jgi:hypothetical protein
MLWESVDALGSILANVMHTPDDQSIVIFMASLSL